MKINFQTNNAAFKDPDGVQSFDDVYRNREVIRILNNIIEDIEIGCDCGSIRDINGNKVGEWSL